MESIFVFFSPFVLVFVFREDYARYRPLRAKHEMSDDETLPGPAKREAMVF